MNEESKKTELSEDALDNVAGGTNEQNMQILKALEGIDPDGVNEVYSAMSNVGGNYEKMGNIASVGVYRLVSKNLGSNVTAFSSPNDANSYLKNGRYISHNDILNEIKKKAAGAESFEIL